MQVKYVQFEYEKDIALIELSTPLDFSSNVSAVCVPKNDIAPRQLCVTVGWGVNKPGGKKPILIKQKVQLNKNNFYRKRNESVSPLFASANDR